MDVLSAAARGLPGSPWKPAAWPMPGTPGTTASRGLPGGLDFLADALGMQSAGRNVRTGGAWAPGPPGFRQSQRALRPCLSHWRSLRVFLATGAATGSFLVGPAGTAARRGLRQRPGPEGGALVVPVHVAVLRHQPAGLRRRRADDPAAARAWPNGSSAPGAPPRSSSPASLPPSRLFLLITQLARYAGDGWLGLMVDARLIGPVRGGPGRLAGVQRPAADAVAAPAADGRPVGLAPAGALRRATPETVVGLAGALAGTGGRLVDPGRPGHPAPAPLHRARRPGTCSPSPWRSSPSGPSSPPTVRSPTGPLALLRDVVLNPLPTLSQLEQNCGGTLDATCLEAGRAGFAGPLGLALAVVPVVAAAYLRRRHEARPPACPADRRSRSSSP